MSENLRRTSTAHILAGLVIALGMAAGGVACRGRTGQSAQTLDSSACNGAIVERVGLIDDERLPETSGITGSSHDAGMWAVNDKGNPAVLTRVAMSGEVLTQATVVGVENIDWEDLGSVTRKGERLLIVGDIGDNDEDRSTITLVVVAEPATADTAVAPRSELTLRYPDGPHNAETLLVHPDGTAAVAVRGDDALLYLIDDVLGADQNVMHAGDSVWDNAEVRAGAVSPDGDLVAMRTATQIRIWELGTSGLAQLAGAPSCTLPLEQAKPEAMTFLGSNRIVVTGEGAAEILLVTLDRADRT